MYSQTSALPLVIGVDVGGSKIAAALVDGQGCVSARVRLATDVSSPDATLDSIAAAVRQCLADAGSLSSPVPAVGLGIPGLVDPQRGLGLASVNLNWRDVPVRDGLQSRLGLPVAIENDVRAAALGEARFGAGRHLDSLVFLVIGTGIAAATVLDGRVLRGAHGLAGEIGHAVLRPDGPQCKCGAYGCFEALAAGPAIADRARLKLANRSLAGQDVPPSDDRFPTAQDVFTAASLGDSLALETISEVANDIALALQFLALALDPQVIVVGGGVTRAGDLFFNPVQSALARLASSNWVFREVYSPSLVQPSALGEDIGILGAAALTSTLL